MTSRTRSLLKIVSISVFLIMLKRLKFQVTDPTFTNYGFVTKEHTVTTRDGYVLTIFQMSKSKKCDAHPYPPVIFMHGLLMSSDTWLDAGPDASLAYLLSEACFDVWLGNVRGNHYGRRHLKLNPDVDPEFWNFSADEIGLYDIPSIIDYVVEYTGADEVNYIGYSQGAGTFFIICSERPSYCDKVRMLIALAPASRLTHTRSRPLRLLADQLRIFEDNLSSLGINEVFSKGGITQKTLSFMCKSELFFEITCQLYEIIFDSVNEGSIKSKTRRLMMDNFPAGTSVRIFARYGQGISNEAFQKYDYGESKNIELYGRPNPPSYNLSAVSTPVVVLYGRNDHMVDPKDIEWLTNSLPNVVESVKVEDPLWNHFDFMYSQHTKRLVFPKVFKYLTHTMAPSKCSIST